MTIVNDPERGSRVLKIRFWDLNERVKRVSKTSTRVLIEEITIFREIQLGCTYSVSEEEWRFSRTEKILLEITSMSRDKLLVGRDYWGEAFLGIASLFFFLLSSFLLVNDLWPNIEGYSIIIIITATLCSLFFFSFCLRWRSVKFFIFVVQIECDDTLEIIVSIYFFFNLSKRIVFVQWYVNHQFWNN